MVKKHCNSKVPEKNNLNDIDQKLLNLPEDKINKIFEMMG